MASMKPQAITQVSISALVIALPVLYVSLLRLPPSTLAWDTTFWFLMSNSIIAIIAADSGMLFFSSAASHDDVPGDDQPAVDVVQEDFCDAMSSVLPSLIPSDELPTAENVMGGEQLPTDMEDHASPAFIKGEDDAANKPSTEMDHALLHRCGGEAAVLALEPSTNENYAMIVKEVVEEDDDEEEVASDPKKTEPVTNECLDEAAAGEDQGPISHPRTTADGDVPDDVNRKETETEGSGPPEEREYWQLSDEELNRKVEEFILRFNRDMIEQEAGVGVRYSS